MAYPNISCPRIRLASPRRPCFRSPQSGRSRRLLRRSPAASKRSRGDSQCPGVGAAPGLVKRFRERWLIVNGSIEVLKTLFWVLS